MTASSTETAEAPRTDLDGSAGPPEESRNVVWGYLVGLASRMIVLFGFYVLSIGPMYWQWYSAKFVNGSPYVAAFYEPLWALSHWVPWFGEWLDFYVQLWTNWGI